MRINIKKSLFWGGSLLSGIGGNVSGALLLTLNQAPVLVVLSDSSDSSSDSSDSSSDSSDSSDASSETECNFNGSGSGSGSGSKCYVENERFGYKLKVEIQQSYITKIKEEVQKTKNYYWPGYTDEKGLIWCIGALKMWFKTHKYWWWSKCGNKHRWYHDFAHLRFPDRYILALSETDTVDAITDDKVKVQQLNNK